MAVPFYLPGEGDNNGTAASAMPANTTPNSPTHPIPQPNANQSLPQIQTIDNEALVQVFYEALCRLPQVPTLGHFSHSQPFFPILSASTSTASTPRNSFRGMPRRRLNSYAGHTSTSFQSFESDYLWRQWEMQHNQREHFEDFPPSTESVAEEEAQPKRKRQKVKRFFIRALQFVIDTINKM